MPSSHRLVALFVLNGATTACVGKQDALRDETPADVMVSVKGDTIAAPDSIRPGWARVRVKEDGAGHIVVIFRLPEAASDADVATFLAALDSAPATPRSRVAMGGAEVGDIGDVVVQFTPGRYVLGCVSRGTDGHRHASTGEAKMFVVPTGTADSTHAAAPHATNEVRMVDFAYEGPEQWAAGRQMLRVENSGRQDHQLRLVRLRAGSSMQDWMTADNPDAHGTPVAGVARMGSGEVVYLPLELSVGTSVAYCLVTDPATSRVHLELGMFRSIHVE